MCKHKKNKYVEINKKTICVGLFCFGLKKKKKKKKICVLFAQLMMMILLAIAKRNKNMNRIMMNEFLPMPITEN
jgi:LytS/YehU family sensor histidine kinase